MARSRRDIIRCGLDKVITLMDKLQQRRYQFDNIEKVVRISTKVSLNIIPLFGNDYSDEEGGYYITGFEVYAMVDGESVDCMTITPYRNAREDVEYLLNCYV